MQPPSFHADWYEDWCRWLLDPTNPLPELPAVLGDDDAVPVARFVGSRFGAVLMIDWGGDADEGLYVSSEIEVFRRSGDGWEASNASGGGGWLDPPFARPPQDTASAVLAHVHESFGLTTTEWAYSATFGFVGAAATSVEVEDRDGLTSAVVESPLGVVMAVADIEEPAVIRVRSGSQVVLERPLLPARLR